MGYLDKLLAPSPAATAPPPATNEPTDAALLAASVERTEHAGDGPDVSPRWEAARPSVDEPTSYVPTGPAGVPVGPPIPVGSVAFSTTVQSVTPVQIVPAAGGRPRRVVIHNADNAKVINISPDRREDGTGFTLDAGKELETYTQAPVWAYVVAGDVLVSVWVDHYPAP